MANTRLAFYNISRVYVAFCVGPVRWFWLESSVKTDFFFKSWWKFTSIIIETSWCIGWKKSWTESFSIQQSYFWLKCRRSEHGEFSMSMFCLKLKLSETNFFYLLEWTKTTRRTLKRRGPGPHKVLSTNLKQLLNGKYTEAYIAECENSVRSL